MFVAACLDARPGLWPEVEAAVAALGLGPEAACRLVAHNDGVLAGRRFTVAAEAAHGHRHESHRHGPHRAWAEIREMLTNAALDKSVAERAVEIFSLLAKAEAEVHGLDEPEVTFHEIGAVDSLVDIVAAALLIDRLAAARWTASPLPLGGGRVMTAHGFLPIPAPATALLLRGLPTIDDGIPGERVTPTGAAIARHLIDDAPRRAPARTIQANGTGFGAKSFPGISNCLRIVLFEELAAPSMLHEEVGVIEFEIDDQSAEDLSLGLDQLRARDGVLDVVQSVVFGKRGRVGVQVRVLTEPARLDEAIEACFVETATIGLRHHIVRRAVLARGVEEVEVGGRRLRVKTVERPGGRITGKTEAVDVAGQPGHAARSALRRAGEAEALARLAKRRSEEKE